MKSIKVLISDFQFLTREGLIKLMEGTQHFDLIGVLENREQWMEQVTQAQPDVLILDYPERQSDMNATPHRIHQVTGEQYFGSYQ